VIGFAMIAILFLLAIARIKKYRRKITKKLRKSAREFFWNGFIRSTNLTYLKSFISMMLALKII
jgi:hypothetical protein